MKNQKTLGRVLFLLKGYRALVAASLLLAAVFVASSLYVPVLVGGAIDAIAAPGRVDFAAVFSFGWKIAALALAGAVSQWAMQAVNNRICFGVTRDVRELAFCHVQTLPLKYLDAHPSGELVSRMIADVDQFADGLLMGFTQLFTGALSILGTLYMMLRLDWRIALVVVILTPASLFAAKFIAGKTYSMFHAQSTTRGEQTAFVSEMIAGQKLVRLFSREQTAMAQFDEINERLRRDSLQATFFSSLVNPTTRLLTSVVYACVGLAGALAAVAGSITVGSLTCFLSYANQYAKPFNEISGVVTELQNAFACAARVFSLIDAPAQTADAPGELSAPDGSVGLSHVSFGYTADRPLITDMNLSVKPGQHIAIVGPTGCGKTTLINLLMRFYDVDAGSILVSNTDIRDITRRSLRRSFGMVLQDTWLKTGTVRENICMGKPDATDSEIIAAAKAAHAHSFIVKLPQGYDTVISGEHSLSLGQRQLLCIARVMLCQPPMLILDEATSSIDTRTESRIQRAFDEMMRGRTSFVVAHRLSTIREADVILVMKDGKIAEQGRHEALLAKNGVYAALYNSQFAHTSVAKTRGV